MPDFPVDTGVPVTFRRVKDDCSFGPYRFLAGDILRVQLQPLGYSDQPELKTAIFGAGVHSCVGRQLSLKLWEHLARAFNGLGLRAGLLAYDVAASHYRPLSFRKNQGVAVTEAEARSLIINALAQCNVLDAEAKTLYERDPGRDVELAALGIDSMAVINLCVALEETIHRDVEIEELIEHPSLNKLARHIVKSAA